MGGVKYSKVEEQPCKRVFKVELDGSEYAQVRGQAMARVSGQVDIPGFRKGKVPPQVVEQRYGRAIDEETIEEAINRGARLILSETGLAPITNPSVSSVARTADGLSFNITIELAPEINLGEYRGLEFRREPVMVRPEDVDSVLEGLRRRQTSYDPADRPARWGDLAVIDYTGTVEGKPFDGGKGEDAQVSIGSRSALAEIENALVGRKAGEAFDVPVAFPPEHASSALAGKTAVFSVSVKEVKIPKTPEIDDEFARKYGECESVEQLRKMAADRLHIERERETQQRLRARVADKIAQFVSREVAPSLVDEETRHMAVRGAEQLARRGIRTTEQIGMKPADFREMFKPAAARAVREAFALEAVAEKEGISVSDEDLEGEIRRESGQSGPEADRALGELKADGRWERLRAKLRQERTLDWIIAQSSIIEREIRI